MTLETGVTCASPESLTLQMRAVVLALLVAVTGVPFPKDGESRLTIEFGHCGGCTQTQPGITIWDTGSDRPLSPRVIERHGGELVIALAPGYYAIGLWGEEFPIGRCNAELYTVVLGGHDRTVSIPLKCRYDGKFTVPLVDRMHGIAGTIPENVVAVTARDATDGSERIATVSNGAYYFDEAHFAFGVADVKLRDGRRARIDLTVQPKPDIAFTRRDISSADVADGLEIKQSPFEVPEKLVEGPEKSVWVLDRLGNRVTQFASGKRPRKVELPTAFGDATDIVGTSKAVWVAEARVGKLVRVRADGTTKEFPVDEKAQDSIALATDSSDNVWFSDDRDFGTIADDGTVKRLGDRYHALLPAAGSRNFRFVNDRNSIVVGNTGIWHSDRDNLTFEDSAKNEKQVRLPIDGFWPHIYAVGKDDTAWFSDRYGNVIGRATPDGKVTLQYAILGPTRISDMETDALGNLWIAEPGTNVIEEYDKGMRIMAPGLHPKFLLVDSLGNLWYSDPVAGFVGVSYAGGHSRCWALHRTLIRGCRVDATELVH